MRHGENVHYYIQKSEPLIIKKKSAPLAENPLASWRAPPTLGFNKKNPPTTFGIQTFFPRRRGGCTGSPFLCLFLAGKNAAKHLITS